MSWRRYYVAAALYSAATIAASAWLLDTLGGAS